MTIKKTTWGAGVAGSLMLLSLSLQAATFNATTTGDADCSDFNCALDKALEAAENNGQDDIVNVAAGTYHISGLGGGTHFYLADPAESFSLTIVGANRDTTILDGDNIGIPLIAASSSSNIIIKNLTIQNGTNNDNGGGLISITETADITLENCLFQNNTAVNSGGGAALASATGGTLIMRNNVFLNNSVTGPNQFGGGLAIFETPGQTIVVNNTFVGNTSNDNGGALCVSMDDNTAIADVSNNIFFNNTAGTSNGHDIFVQDDRTVVADGIGGIVRVKNNYFRSFFDQCRDEGSCTANLTESGNISSAADPGFVNTAGNNFHLQTTSACVDTGLSSASGLPSLDFEGDPRVSGSAPEMGVDELTEEEIASGGANTTDGNEEEIGSGQAGFGVSGGSCTLINDATQTQKISSLWIFAFALSAIQTMKYRNSKGRV